MKRIICCICTLALLVATLSSCVYMHHGAPQFRREWSEIRDHVTDIVMYSGRNGEGDKEIVYEILKHAFSEEEFNEEYERMNSLFNDLSGTFSVEVDSFSSEKKDGITVKHATLSVKTDTGEYTVEASCRSDTDGLVSFSLLPVTQSASSEKESN